MANGFEDNFNFEDAFNDAAGANAGAEEQADNADKEKVENEKKAEKKRILDELFDVFNTLVIADNFTDVFGPIDTTLDQKGRLAKLKGTFRRLSIVCHTDNKNGFTPEVHKIAEEAIKTLNAFYDEAKGRISGNFNQKDVDSRRRWQEAARVTADADIAAAFAAEDILNNDDAKEKAETAEEECKQNEEKERIKKEEEDRILREKEEERLRAEQEAREKTEQEARDAGTENSEKEGLIFGLPEKVFNVFEKHANTVWDFYVNELSGKNGEKGYLDNFSDITERNQFLALNVKVLLRQKIADKATILTEKYNFPEGDQEKIVNHILDLIKKDKTK